MRRHFCFHLLYSGSYRIARRPAKAQTSLDSSERSLFAQSRGVDVAKYAFTHIWALSRQTFAHLHLLAGIFDFFQGVGLVITLSRKRLTKFLIRQHGCADWSVPLNSMQQYQVFLSQGSITKCAIFIQTVLFVTIFWFDQITWLYNYI